MGRFCRSWGLPSSIVFEWRKYTLASRVQIRDYEGTLTIQLAHLSHVNFFICQHYNGIFLQYVFAKIYMLLGISVSTFPMSRLLINPDIQENEDFEGW